MKLQPRKLKETDKQKYVNALDTLYATMAGLNDKEEIKKFIKQLLTESERIMVGRRILIAEMLLKDESFEKIIRELGVGSDTIMRVHHWLENEQEGIERVIAKLRESKENRKKVKDNIYYDPLSFKGIKKRYPGHFALFDLISKLSE